MDFNRETLSPGKNFCSVVTRKVNTIKKRKRIAICKIPRSAWERELIRTEILFYCKILPLFNVLNKLFFSRENLPNILRGCGNIKRKSLPAYRRFATLSYQGKLTTLRYTISLTKARHFPRHWFYRRLNILHENKKRLLGAPSYTVTVGLGIWCFVIDNTWNS